MEPTQIGSIAFSVVNFFVFSLVARVIAKRDVSQPMRAANRAFVTWWVALALTSLGGGLRVLLAALGYLDLSFHIALTMVLLAILCVAMWGLLYYFLVLIANAGKMAVPLGVAYAAFAVYLGNFVLSARPTRVVLGKWNLAFDPKPATDSWQTTLVVALFFVPVLLAVLAYLGLYFRVEDKASKRRILIVGFSILVWFGTSAAVGSAGEGVSASDTWMWTSRILGLAAASAIGYAFVGITPKTGVEAPASQEGTTPENPALVDKPGRLAPLAGPSVV